MIGPIGIWTVHTWEYRENNLTGMLLNMWGCSRWCTFAGFCSVHEKGAAICDQARLILGAPVLESGCSRHFRESNRSVETLAGVREHRSSLGNTIFLKCRAISFCVLLPLALTLNPPPSSLSLPCRSCKFRCHMTGTPCQDRLFAVFFLTPFALATPRAVG